MRISTPLYPVALLGLLVAAFIGCGSETELEEELVNPLPDQSIQLQPTVPVAPVTQVSGSTGDGQCEAVHTVAKFDKLLPLSRELAVNFELLVLANEDQLRANYERACNISEVRASHWCNEGLERPYVHALTIGQQLRVPPCHGMSEATVQRIETVIEQALPPVALVIDETGSMGNDIAAVSEISTTYLVEQDREISGIFLFADGQVRNLGDVSHVDPRNSGNFENVAGAVSQAFTQYSGSKPESIVVITDERGDDHGSVDLSGVDIPIHVLFLDSSQYYGELHQMSARTGGEFTLFNR